MNDLTPDEHNHVMPNQSRTNVIRHRIKASVYAKLSGNLAMLLDMANEHGLEWLRSALVETQKEYAGLVDEHQAKSDETQPADPAEEADRLRAALTDALEGMQEIRGYVSDYFAEKWGHDEYIARARAALGEVPRPLQVSALSPDAMASAAWDRPLIDVDAELGGGS